ncbi:hypothetical protein C5C25_00680 [Rathayibacter sp. AY2B9]|nr:hypothetical protein C5C25_00680 [Rathayibacter sp. AY2B9]
MAFSARIGGVLSGELGLLLIRQPHLALTESLNADRGSRCFWLVTPVGSGPGGHQCALPSFLTICR